LKRLSIALTPDGDESGSEGLKTVADDWEQSGTCLGQGQRPRPSPEESASTIELQQSDLMTDRGWRDAKLRRRVLEA
jgi:hypothetical protein